MTFSLTVKDDVKPQAVFLPSFSIKALTVALASYPSSKIVFIIDDNHKYAENQRQRYERIYPLYKNRITMYEGNSYLLYSTLKSKYNVVNDTEYRAIM